MFPLMSQKLFIRGEELARFNDSLWAVSHLTSRASLRKGCEAEYFKTVFSMVQKCVQYHRQGMLLSGSVLPIVFCWLCG